MTTGEGARWEYRRPLWERSNIPRHSRAFSVVTATALRRRHRAGTHRAQHTNTTQKDTQWDHFQISPGATSWITTDGTLWTATVLEIWREITLDRWIHCQEKVLSIQRSRPQILWITGTVGSTTGTVRCRHWRTRTGSLASIIRYLFRTVLYCYIDYSISFMS